MLTVSVFCKTLIDRCHCEWCLYWLILCLVSFPFWNQQQCDCWPHKDSINLTEHIFSGVHVKEIKKKKTFFLCAISLWFGMMIAPMIWSICRKSVLGGGVEQRLYPVMLPRWRQSWTYDSVSERERKREIIGKDFGQKYFFFPFFFPLTCMKGALTELSNLCSSKQQLIW